MGKLQALPFKSCAYKIKDMKGKNIYGDGKVDFLEAKYKEPHNSKFYDFNKFTSGIAEDSTTDKPKRSDFLKKDFDEDVNGDIDPIRTDITDSKYLFNNDDAMVFDLNKKE